MLGSCGWNGWGEDNTDEELAFIKQSIAAATAQTLVDSQFVLAVMMQESKGCVRVITTNNGVRNPGLMQSHNGVHTCNDEGSVLYPCPQEQVLGMITDGTVGTDDSDDDGLNALINQAIAYNQATGASAVTRDYAQVFYQAARLYNSGSTSPNWANLNDANGATATYVDDIVNRLLGWVDS